MEVFLSQFNYYATIFIIPFFLFIGIYFTIQLRGVQFLQVGKMVRLIFKKNEDKEAVSSFQAFTMALAARVGVGSLAGVALAIIKGGAGAIFWMWVVALIGGATAFVESTLAQIFKEKNKDGHTFRGGPAYYMHRGLGKYRLGFYYSILIIVVYTLGFTAIQTNTIASAFKEAFHIEPIFSGIVVAILIGIITFGGVKSIASTTEKIVPFMAITYIAVATFVIVTHFGVVINALTYIVTDAFNIRSMGLAAFLTMIITGFNRGIFTNEAGLGSGAIAAATAKVDHPVEQGLIQALGVYVTTIIICTATALIVLVSGAHTDVAINNGIEITQRAVSFFIGDFGTFFIAISVFFFAFSTILSGYYYGESSVQYIKNNPIYIQILRIVVLVVIVLSSFMRSDILWNLVDIMVIVIAFFNLIALNRLLSYAKNAWYDYRKQSKKTKHPQYRNRIVDAWK